ncbi:hypothetical protein LZZ85_00320 [Terrimonas sp. NA20]|uniref:Band 7 domain-containing protein n=1 Tax=Terrimonas ginsenosidimutans TaxID=2908004 RepID=A0ABS9KK56_9BACT|nr:hypothetical protein [Terrimonas ginsenosidimutans]MCG2612694.1 hypothetical protein [Terrimonas ginsenosidimutans]
MKKTISSKRSDVSLGDIAPAFVTTFIAIVQWVGWTPIGGGLLGQIVSMSAGLSFGISIALFAGSLYLLYTNDSLIRLGDRLSFHYFKDKPALYWLPGKKNLCVVGPRVVLLIVCALLFLRILTTGYSQGTGLISLLYFLLLLVIAGGLIKIPALQIPKVTDGVEIYSPFEVYGFFDVSRILCYTQNTQTGNWTKKQGAVIIDGEPVVFFEPLKSLSMTGQIPMNNAAFDATININLLPVVSNFPAELRSDDLDRLMTWSNAAAKDRAVMVNIAAAQLSPLFEKQIKLLFGISENNQLLFDNLAAIIKQNAIKAWDAVSSLNAGLIGRALEDRISAAMLGNSYRIGSHVVTSSVAVEAVSLKGYFRDLNETIRSISSTNHASGNAMRAGLVDKLSDMLLTYCPNYSPEQIVQEVQKLISPAPPVDTRIIEEPSSPIVITGSGRLIDTADTQQLEQKAKDMEQVGDWLERQTDLEERLATGAVWFDIYFQLTEKRLIEHLRPGMDTNELARGMAEVLKVETADLLDPQSRLYRDRQYQISIFKNL